VKSETAVTTEKVKIQKDKQDKSDKVAKPLLTKPDLVKVGEKSTEMKIDQLEKEKKRQGEMMAAKRVVEKDTKKEKATEPKKTAAIMKKAEKTQHQTKMEETIRQIISKDPSFSQKLSKSPIAAKVHEKVLVKEEARRRESGQKVEDKLEHISQIEFEGVFEAEGPIVVMTSEKYAKETHVEARNMNELKKMLIESHLRAYENENRAGASSLVKKDELVDRKSLKRR